MCGIFGIYQTNGTVASQIHDALELLQHRGQDSAGIVTLKGNKSSFKKEKGAGLVSSVFNQENIDRLDGNVGIGHVRYKTSGTNSFPEVQPFTSSKFRGLKIALAHNGHLSNFEKIKSFLRSAKVSLSTNSDSEAIIAVLSYFWNKQKHTDKKKRLIDSLTEVYRICHGAFSVVALVEGIGLIAFRDSLGIRPLLLGKRIDPETNLKHYAFSSEKAPLDLLGFNLERDVLPGELVCIDSEGNLHSDRVLDSGKVMPCLFEFIYLSRPDSVIENTLVYKVRKEMGHSLVQRIKQSIETDEIDFVVPVPETSCIIAQEVARILNKEYAEVLVKNRYIGRTFIQDGQSRRVGKVTKKFNVISSLIKGKNLLVIDDSIVRGTTCKKIVHMLKENKANKVFFVSASPPVRHKNIYGIDIADDKDLIAKDSLSVGEIKNILGCDELIYENLDSLIESIKRVNKDLQFFETSIFDGHYITEDPDFINLIEQPPLLGFEK